MWPSWYALVWLDFKLRGPPTSAFDGQMVGQIAHLVVGMIVDRELIRKGESKPVSLGKVVYLDMGRGAWRDHFLISGVVRVVGLVTRVHSLSERCSGDTVASRSGEPRDGLW